MKLSKLFCACMMTGVLFNTAYATDSTLKINNYVNGVEVDIATDLLCKTAAQSVFRPGNIRYTSSLDENPIKYNQPTTAIWKNCTIAANTFFAKNDHSKLYIDLKDLKSGDIYHMVYQVNSEIQTRTINLAGKNMVVSLSHFGDYGNETVVATNTTIDITPAA